MCEWDGICAQGRRSDRKRDRETVLVTMAGWQMLKNIVTDFIEIKIIVYYCRSLPIGLACHFFFIQSLFLFVIQ